MNNLGVLYDQGHGVEPDTGRALHWFAQSAKAGHPSGMSNYGRMLEQGRGIAANPQEAARWFDLAARQGQPKPSTIWGCCTNWAGACPRMTRRPPPGTAGRGQQQSESLARLGHFYRAAGAWQKPRPGRAAALRGGHERRSRGHPRTGRNGERGPGPPGPPCSSARSWTPRTAPPCARL